MNRAFFAVLLAAVSTTFTLAQAPANDECSGALPLSFGVNPTPASSGNTYSNVGATTSAGVTATCTTATNSDVWFSFTPPTSGDYVFSTNTPGGFTAGSLTDTVLSVYASCGGAQLGCDDDSGALSRSVVRINNLVAGTPYFVRVADDLTSIATGTFYLTVSTPITNDDCLTPTPLSFGINPTPGTSGNLFTNEAATEVPNIVTSCQTSDNSDVWFVYTPTQSCPHTISTDTPAGFAAGTITDTIVSVYASCGGPEIACDDDSGVAGALLSVVTVNLTAGTPYLIRVADFSTSVDQGTFYLSIDTVFTLSFSSPLGPGSIQANLDCGPANGTYYLAVTVTPGAFPNGWFYGIDISIGEIVDQVNTGAPFVGTLDANGSAQIGPFSGLPSGLTFYAVGLAFTGSLYSLPVNTTAPVSYTVP